MIYGNLQNVIPIFKKGEKSQPSDYKPVALLSCVGKLRRKDCVRNMYIVSIDNKILYEYQSGFLPHH